MNPPQSQPRVWVISLVVLAVAAAGANYFFYLREPDKSVRSEPNNAAAAPNGEGPVVCFGHVDVEYGVRSLYPLQSGRVVKVGIGESAAGTSALVKKGTMLLRLDDRQAKADLRAAEAQLQLAQQGCDQHDSKIAQQNEAIQATARRLSAARHVYARKQKLLKGDQTSIEEVKAGEDLVKELEAALRAEEEKRNELKITDPKLLVDAKKALRDEAQLAVDECTLYAPEDGEVLRVLVGPGDVLGGQAKQPAILFCPTGPRFIRAEVPQEFADRVKEGMSASIQNDTRATKTWQGKVQRISSWFTQKRSIMHEPLQVNDVRTLECIVQLDPEPSPPFRIGQRLRVTIGE